MSVINHYNKDTRPSVKNAENDDSLVNNKLCFVVVIQGYRNILKREPYIKGETLVQHHGDRKKRHLHCQHIWETVREGMFYD